MFRRIALVLTVIAVALGLGFLAPTNADTQWGRTAEHGKAHKPNHVPQVHTNRVYVSACTKLPVAESFDPEVCVDVDYDSNTGYGFYIARVGIFASADSCTCWIQSVDGYALTITRDGGNVQFSKDGSQTNTSGNQEKVWYPGAQSGRTAQYLHVHWSGRVAIGGAADRDFTIDKYLS